MVTLYVLNGDGTVTGEFSVPTLFAALRDPTCTFWLDMLKPTDEEIALLDDVFGFHPLAIADCIYLSSLPTTGGALNGIMTFPVEPVSGAFQPGTAA